MIEEPQRLRQAVLEKGLFDEAYYEANYGELIPPGEPLIDHFVRVGFEAGAAPCESFDPALHEVLHGSSSPSDWPDRAQAEAGRPDPAAVFPNLDLGIEYFDAKSGEEDRAKLQGILDNPTRSVTLPSPYGAYKFRNPAAADILDRVRSGKPFAFVRLPHGFWDCCTAVERVTADLQADPRTAGFSAGRRRALAIRLMRSRWRRNGNFAGDYLDTILDDVRRHPREPGMFTGIAMKGYPTYEDSAFGCGDPRPEDMRRAVGFMRLFSPHDRLYDATVFKRWAILGGLKDLPDALRDRPLILVARNLFSALAERLDLPQLTVVDVPFEGTQLIRRKVLSRIEAAIQSKLDADPQATPVVLFQSGASVGYWFIRRLRPKFPRAVYLDIGQALDIWCMDLVGLHSPWVAIYHRQFYKACGIDPPSAAQPA